jgi:hypothetical protein
MTTRTGTTGSGTTTTDASRRGGAPALRTVLAVLCGGAALFGAACQDEEEKRPPGQADVDRITASVASIVFQCRSVEQGFLASADEQVLTRDVKRLERAAEEVEPDARYRLPESTLERRTTLRDQVELAARTLDEGCSPEDAERLREAVGD